MLTIFNRETGRGYSQGRGGDREASATLGVKLKELSHEIEMCGWWYGWIELYLEMNL